MPVTITQEPDVKEFTDEDLGMFLIVHKASKQITSCRVYKLDSGVTLVKFLDNYGIRVFAEYVDDFEIISKLEVTQNRMQ